MSTATSLRVLVTGATSLLGGATVERLLERGDQVTVLQRSRVDDARLAGVVQADFADPDRGALDAALERAVARQDAVVHLAAKVDVVGHRDDFEAVNVRGTARLLDIARQAGVDRFIHVSSPSVAHGGEALVGAGPEPANPATTRGHYATTKAQAEVLALAASDADFPVLAIRPHLVWGPGDTQLVERIVARARAGRLGLVGSGTALIDSTYIDNAADALVASVDAAPRLGGRALVVSNGEPRTVAELVTRIVGAAGLGPPRVRVPRAVALGAGALLERIWERQGRADDPPMTSFLAEQLSTAHWFDQRQTRDALRWSPAVGLDEGFDRLAAWYSEQGPGQIA